MATNRYHFYSKARFCGDACDQHVCVELPGHEGTHMDADGYEWLSLDIGRTYLCEPLAQTG